MLIFKVTDCELVPVMPTEEGNEHVALAGHPVTPKSTVPVYPLDGVTVIEELVFCPWVMVAFEGDAETEKLADGAAPPKPVRPRTVPMPMAKSQSLPAG